MISVLDSVDRSFAATYDEARDRFLAACEGHGVTLRACDNPNQGPGREALTTDVVWFGPQHARGVFMTISGTHGAEGFRGSGCQVHWLLDGGPGRLPHGIAALLVHAINPTASRGYAASSRRAATSTATSWGSTGRCRRTRATTWKSSDCVPFDFRWGCR